MRLSFFYFESEYDALLRVCLIVILTKTGPRCISFRCKITVSLAQGAVHDAEADVADPVFVRSTITTRARRAQVRASQWERDVPITPQSRQPVWTLLE